MSNPTGHGAAQLRPIAINFRHRDGGVASDYLELRFTYRPEVAMIPLSQSGDTEPPPS